MHSHPMILNLYSECAVYLFTNLRELLRVWKGSHFHEHQGLQITFFENYLI